MLFIIVHQASELWLKLCLHELFEARECIRADRLRPSFKMLARVARAQGQLIQSWDVLSTMTPHDYSTIRPHLGGSSGFQSAQYRMMEFLLGGRNPDMITMHEATPEVAEALREELTQKSIYAEAIALLARRGFAIPEDILDRDHGSPWDHSPAVEAAWAEIYRDPKEYWDLYELAEKLVDLEYHFQRWRFQHMTTVERVIGHKRGTGGTSGAPYLRRALDTRLFPELWQLRTEL